MFWKSIIFGALSMKALASPIQDVHGLSYDHDLEWISKDSSLPKVV